jgi:predicted transcriptional regulator
MRRQFVLDKHTDKLLENLAIEGGGNRSMIVRAAIQHFADMQDYLEKIESDPAFQKMMAQSEADIRAGRVTSHEEVLKRLRKQRKKR